MADSVVSRAFKVFGTQSLFLIGIIKLLGSPSHVPSRLETGEHLFYKSKIHAIAPPIGPGTRDIFNGASRNSILYDLRKIANPIVFIGAANVESAIVNKFLGSA